MKQYGVLLAFLALVIAATAYPGLNPDVSDDSTVDPVDRAIRQQSSEFLRLIYRKPHPQGSPEVIEELIVASMPESIRQNVAEELATADGASLSDELKERINLHILDWALQFVPEDLRKDLSAALEEYKATGQVSGSNDQLLERVRQYVTRLESGRNKRGSWEALAIAAAERLANKLFNQWGWK